MHRVTSDQLEEFLASTIAPHRRRELEAHLEACDQCRDELREMQELRDLMAVLRASEPVSPDPGFYYRLSQRVEAERPRPFWSVLFEPLLVRRVAMAALLSLAVMGSYLTVRESGYGVGPSTESILAMEQNAPESSPVDREMMLVTLASYDPFQP